MNVKALIKPVAVLAAVFVLLLALSAGLAPTAAENAAAEQARLFDTLLPGGAPFTEEAYNGEDTAIAAVHRGSTGYLVETVTAGYAGDITMLVAVDFDGAVVGAVVREMEETFGLGAEALSAAVLPAVGLPAAAACSLLALAAEAYLSKGVPRRNWGLTLLLGALTFGLLPWAAGLTAGTEAVRFAVVGGAAFGALTFLFTSLRERLASGPSGRLAPLVTAGILFLACQCFAGMLL